MRETEADRNWEKRAGIKRHQETEKGGGLGENLRKKEEEGDKTRNEESENRAGKKCDGRSVKRDERWRV